MNEPMFIASSVVNIFAIPFVILSLWDIIGWAIPLIMTTVGLAFWIISLIADEDDFT